MTPAPASELYLIDGSVELFRCFHAAPRKEVRGREGGACAGLFWTLVKLLRDRPATHVAVAFDAMPRSAPSDRTESGLIRGQAPLAFEVVRALGIALWPMVRFQADDGLATGAARLSEQIRTVICTTDKDLLQCVRGDTVVVWDRIRDVEHTEESVRAKWGVAPGQMPSLQALIGDRSDGLLGVPGWGKAAAAAALTLWGSVGQIPLDGAAWPSSIRRRAHLAKQLSAWHSEALLAEALGRLHNDLPLLGTSLDALAWRGPRKEARLLAEELGVELALEKLAASRPECSGTVALS